MTNQQATPRDTDSKSKSASNAMPAGGKQSDSKSKSQSGGKDSSSKGGKKASKN